jgi:hypothetical protein
MWTFIILVWLVVYLVQSSNGCRCRDETRTEMWQIILRRSGDADDFNENMKEYRRSQKQS